MSEFGVSIIISTWNRKHHLLKLVQSLLLQEVDFSCEILIVDSDSPDLSEQFIADNLCVPSRSWFSIRYLHTTNSLSAKRNYGAKCAKHPYLVFLDDDMFVPIHDYMSSIKQSITALDMSNTIVSGYVRFPPDYLKSGYFKYKDIKHLWPEAEADCSKVPSGKFIAMNFLIKKIVYFKLSGFDESFIFYGGEDRDFEFRSRDDDIVHLISKKMFAYHCEGSGSTYGYYKKIKKNSAYGFNKIKIKYGLERFGSRIVQVERIYEYLEKGRISRWIAKYVIRCVSLPILLVLVLSDRFPFSLIYLYDFYYLLAHLEGAFNRDLKQGGGFL